MTSFIIGYGDIGRRVAALAQATGDSVSAITRQVNQPTLINGITLLPGDLDQPDALPTAAMAGTQLYYFAPPPEQGTTDPRLRQLLDRLHAHKPAKIVYISTTGVYGNAQGAWVDEDTPPAPQTERGKRRLDAEQQLQHWSSQTGVPAVILRVPGIYGPGRIPIEAVQAGRPVVQRSEAGYTNRIHADDLAHVCHSAMARGAPGRIYNVTDGQQSSMTDYFLTIAEVFELPHPPEISWAEAQRTLSPGLLSYLGESRRVSNRRLVDELGITLRYPTLKDGLLAIRAARG